MSKLKELPSNYLSWYTSPVNIKRDVDKQIKSLKSTLVQTESNNLVHKCTTDINNLAAPDFVCPLPQICLVYWVHPGLWSLLGLWVLLGLLGL